MIRDRGTTRSGGLGAIGAAALMLLAGPAAGAEEAPRYNRDVRPILSDRCFACHGPDSAARKADLRLDRRDDAIAAGAIVPGDASASELWKRIVAHDPDDVMPPPSAKKPAITDAERAIIARWIDAGAEYEPHWAYVAPAPTAPPASPGARHPIDAFIAADLARTSMPANGPADPVALCRRVTLDLTGLPPTPEEVDAFVVDDRPDAYERLVDRLLASDRHAEHEARIWLDAARYGDTHGLHLDNRRDMWVWRDWVIDAIRANMPFDRFATEQLAGDLLPEPTLEQRIASGFVRCHVTTSEGGAIDEEYLVKYAVDRVETVSTVFMGLTAGCASCHDHKYDPLTQRDFYRLFAFFNSTAEAAMDGNAAAPPPVVRVPTESDRLRLAELDGAIAARRAERDRDDAVVDAAQRDWERELRTARAGRWTLPETLAVRSREGIAYAALDDGSWLGTGPFPARDAVEIDLAVPAGGLSALRLEALTDPSLPAAGPGGGPDNGNLVLSEIEAFVLGADGAEGPALAFGGAAADLEQTGFPVEAAIDGSADDAAGWALLDGNRKTGPRAAVFALRERLDSADAARVRVRLRFESRYAGHSIGRFRLRTSGATGMTASRRGPWAYAGPFTAADAAAAFATDFGAESADAAAPLAGDRVWHDRRGVQEGVVHRLSEEPNSAHYLATWLDVPSARRLRLILGSDDGIKVLLDGRTVHANDVARVAAPAQDVVEVDVPAGEHRLVIKVVNQAGGCAFAARIVDRAGEDVPQAVADALERDESERAPELGAALRDHFRRRVWEEGRALETQLAELDAEKSRIESAAPTTLVAAELPMRRQAFVLKRGDYDKPGEPVEAGVPDWLPPLPDGAPANRLGLAAWLFDPAHPLTARVTANRAWQQHFGTGLVRTSEDFGLQGAPPTHPELLDWLARWLVDAGWDMRALHRLIVTSEAYRRDSSATPAQWAADPGNRRLARGPRFRMDAEVIRDLALASSGLLVEQVGGPPVNPYQPSGIWEAVGYTSSNTAKFSRDDGDALWRRSMYTFWKRTAPPAALATLDAPTRETCTVRRERTNTPLAALLLLNDVQFVEAARMLAERGLHEGGVEPKAAIERMFRLVLARHPDADELALLLDLQHEEAERYAADPAAADALLEMGEASRDRALDPVLHASLTSVANVLLNLDEAITRG